MKKTLFLVAILLPLLIFSSSFNNPVSSSNIAGDCCQTFKITDERGNPLQGCKLEVFDPNNNKVGECLTNLVGECEVCGLNPKVQYHVVPANCSCTQVAFYFYCGVQVIVNITPCTQ